MRWRQSVIWEGERREWWFDEGCFGIFHGLMKEVWSLPLTELLISIAVPMLNCLETGHWWIVHLQGDVYFVIKLHICMYLWGGWLLLPRITPHVNMMDLAVWKNGQLSNRDIQPTLCSHDGWAFANIPHDQRWSPASPWPVEEGFRGSGAKSIIMQHAYWEGFIQK